MTDETRAGTILVVDDEAAARISLAEILRLEGYHVLTAASGEEALRLLAHEERVDLVMLDIKMSGLDGIEVLEAIQQRSLDTIVVLLTAFGTLETAIRAMRHGAHDYLLKPCSVPEILRSVQSGLARKQHEQQRHQLVHQLRRTLSALVEIDGQPATEEAQVPQTDRFLTVRNVTLDRQNQMATLDDRPLDLTPTEFKILLCLMSTPDQVWSPEKLVENVQGYDADPWGARAIVRVHIRRLRKKLEPEPSDPVYVLNVRGVGYLFASGEVEVPS
jgi:DNA-binding response OmpR family regulator